MYGIFRESLVILQNYYGTLFWFLLYAVSAGYLFVCEKNKTKRILVLYVPLAILIAFLLPPVRMVYVAVFDEGNTYYRLLWLVPFCITCAYAAACAFAKHTRIGLVLCCALIALAGKPVYKSIHMRPAENAYHLPQVVVELCDLILEDAGVETDTDRVRCAFPADLVHYVRQYDTRIHLVFGREMVEPVWDHWNFVYSAMEEHDVIDMQLVTNLRESDGFRYLVLHSGRKTSADPETFGFAKVGERGDFVVYRFD